MSLETMTQTTRGKEERAPTRVQRRAPYSELLELLDDYEKGVTPLCYRRLNDRVCGVTGKPFEPSDDEGWAKHQAALAAQREKGATPAAWQPTQDNLESRNQSMMIAEGWKDVVLRWLQAKSFTRERVLRMVGDPHSAEELRLVFSCYRLLYYICWDHPDNWQPFSNAPTLRFLARAEVTRQEAERACRAAA